MSCSVVAEIEIFTETGCVGSSWDASRLYWIVTALCVSVAIAKGLFLFVADYVEKVKSGSCNVAQFLVKHVELYSSMVTLHVCVVHSAYSVPLSSTVSTQQILNCVATGHKA